MAEVRKLTDTLPRVAVGRILDALSFIAASGSVSFEDVRLALVRLSPGSRQSVNQPPQWNTTRDITSDLLRLGYLEERWSNKRFGTAQSSTFEATERGRSLAALNKSQRSLAFDELLSQWLNSHPYFRGFMARLSESPLFLPSITSIRELNVDAIRAEDHARFVGSLIESCTARLRIIGVKSEKLSSFSRAIVDRFQSVSAKLKLGQLGSKQLVDAIEDRVIIPSLLSAEELPFDTVTFQHLIRASQEFFTASWTTAHPSFEGRVIFSTCDIHPEPKLDEQHSDYRVTHHGRAYALPRFPESLLSGYSRLASTGSSYVNAFQLRALVCVDLAITPLVFSACLNDIANTDDPNLAIYTELPFESAPKGESYIELNKKRIGLIRISMLRGKHGSKVEL